MGDRRAFRSMSSITETTPNFNSQAQICALGHPLGNCPARRVAGCRNHYELLHYMHPSMYVLGRIKTALGTDPDVRRWLADIDAVLPGGRREQGRVR